MRRAPVTNDDIDRWKAQGLGAGEGATYKAWIDVRCFSSKGRMSRRPSMTTHRMHHLFSDNEDYFFLMADYAPFVVDIREQFPLFPESSTQEIAQSMGVRHPKWPYSTTPLVMTTDFLLTVIDKSGSRSLIAWSLKSTDELRGRSRKSVLAKLEIERRYWLQRSVPWRLFTSEDFDQILIDNLDWLSYLTVENGVDAIDFAAKLPTFLSAFESVLSQGLALKDQLRNCAAALGGAAYSELVTDMFRYCVWHQLISLDLSVPIGLQRIPKVRSVRQLQTADHCLGGRDGTSSNI